MRNDDYQTIRKIVEYCDTIESLLKEYQKAAGKNFSEERLSNCHAACALFKLANS